MEHTRTRLGRRLPIIVAIAALLATALPVAFASADEDLRIPDVERVNGAGPVSISVALSRQLFPEDGSAGSVVLARKDAFPDALGASPLAAKFGGPILFTSQDRLDDGTLDELQRVLRQGRQVFLMGGEAALSQSIFDRLESLGYDARRFSGATRVETAALAALQVSGASGAAILVRARGDAGMDATQGWVDSVSCSGYAAANGVPILLSEPQDPGLHPATRSALDRLRPDKVFICGGTAAVPEAHAQELRDRGIVVERLRGANRIETAIAVAKGLWKHGTPTGQRFLIVPGYGPNYGFGLAASQLSGSLGAPILLVGQQEPTACAGDQPSRLTLCYLSSGGDIAGLTAIGSDGVISDAVLKAAADAGGLEQDLTAPSVPAGIEVIDTPEDGGNQLTASWEASTDDRGGTVAYEVWVREVQAEEGDGGGETQSGPVTCDPADPEVGTSTECTAAGLQPESEASWTAEFADGSTEEGTATADADGNAVFTVPVADAEGEYTVTVTGVAEDESEYQESFTGTVVAPQPEPAPNDPAAAGYTKAGATIETTATVELCGFEEEVDSEGNPTGKKTATCAGETYEVGITAVDEFGNRSALSETAEAAPTDEIPAAPETAPNLQRRPSAFTLVSWVPAPEADAAGYAIDRGTPNSFDGTCGSDPTGFLTPGWKTIATVEGGGETSYLDQTTQAGNEYCYRYRVIDTTGNESENSPAAGPFEAGSPD